MKVVSCVVIAGLLGTGAANATIALNGTISTVANASIDDVLVSDLGYDTWSLIPRTLNANVSATNTYGESILVTRGQVQATWSSADIGTVLFQNYGWDRIVVGTMPGSHSSLYAGPGGHDWSYSFTATGNGRLVMDYDVSVGPGDAFGLLGWHIAFSGAGTGDPVPDAVDPTASGTFVGLLEDGVTYTIGLDTLSNIGFGGTTPDHHGAPMRGLFAWVIAYDVPAPSSLLVAAAGLGLLVWRRPNRKKAVGISVRS